MSSKTLFLSKMFSILALTTGCGAFIPKTETLRLSLGNQSDFTVAVTMYITESSVEDGCNNPYETREEFEVQPRTAKNKTISLSCNAQNLVHKRVIVTPRCNNPNNEPEGCPPGVNVSGRQEVFVRCTNSGCQISKTK